MLATDRSITVIEGFTVILPCDSKAIRMNYPGWTYELKAFTDGQDLRLENLNTTDKQGRVLWANNQRDIVITDVRYSDKGEYYCYGEGILGPKLNLVVEGKLVPIIKYYQK